MLLLLLALPSSTNPALPWLPCSSPSAPTHAHGFSRGFSTGAGLCSLSCKFQMHKSNATHLIFTISLCFAAATAAPAPALSQAYAKGCCAMPRVCQCVCVSVCASVSHACYNGWLAMLFGLVRFILLSLSVSRTFFQSQSQPALYPSMHNCTQNTHSYTHTLGWHVS